jgi:hypothetical protein
LELKLQYEQNAKEMSGMIVSAVVIIDMTMIVETMTEEGIQGIINVMIIDKEEILGIIDVVIIDKEEILGIIDTENRAGMTVGLDEMIDKEEAPIQTTIGHVVNVEIQIIHSDLNVIGVASQKEEATLDSERSGIITSGDLVKERKLHRKDREIGIALSVANQILQSEMIVLVVDAQRESEALEQKDIIGNQRTLYHFTPQNMGKGGGQINECRNSLSGCS